MKKPVKMLRKFFYVEMSIVFLVLVYLTYTTAQESIEKAIVVLPFYILWGLMVVVGITDKDLSDSKF
jgi:hypothetical protein